MSTRYVTVKMTETEARNVRAAAVMILAADDGAESFGFSPSEAAAGLRGCSKIAGAVLGEKDDE